MEERVQQSIELAEKVATAELNLRKAQAAQGNPALREAVEFADQMTEQESVEGFSKRLLEQYQRALESDATARLLMPQARVKVRIMDERKLALAGATLGELVEAVDDLATRVAEGIELDSSIAQFNYPQDQQDWLSLLAALDKPNKPDLCEALRDIVTAALQDMLHRNLPPLPPPYELEGVVLNAPIVPETSTDDIGEQPQRPRHAHRHKK